MDKSKRSGITRRQFAKASSVASFAILSARPGMAATNGDTLKVGLLGCGNRGTGAAINMLEGKNNVKLVAMADVFQDRLDGARNKLKSHKDGEVTKRFAVEDDMCFVGLDAYKKILATDIDIVIEGTLPYSRPTHLAAAVDAGKHIFTEKPVASDPYGINIVLEAAEKHKKKGLSFVAGTQRRHAWKYQETIEKLQNGEIGEIKACRAYWCGSLPFLHKRKPDWSDLEYCIRNWYAFCWVAADNIVEQHVHNLDVINWVMGGPPERVFASGGRSWKPYGDPDYGDIFDHFSCDFEYDNGVRMTSMSRHWYRCAGGVFEDVVGTKGRSDCQDMDAGNVKKQHDNPYVQEHIDLVNSITGEGPYWHQGKEVAESTMTAILGRESAYTGQVQRFSRALRENKRITPEKLDFGLEYPCRPVPRPGAPE